MTKRTGGLRRQNGLDPLGEQHQGSKAGNQD